MRSEAEILDLIIQTAQADARIRAVILNGSRVNPQARRDPFQDFDVVYLVTAIASFVADATWIDRFGARIILQMPEAMSDPPPMNDGHFAYLMQFTDGNRIDLTLFPLDRLASFGWESLSVVLLDKDGRIGPLPPPSDRDYWPTPPTAQAFADCCNEFWWVSTYVAKGLWRAEIFYAKAMLDQVVREQLMKMLTWYVGIKTDFARNPGKVGKQFKVYLEPELWTMLTQTYTDTDEARNWDALLTMAALFRQTGLAVATHFGFAYPHQDDERVTAHLQHVRALPKDATTIY
ncbi:MAG: aminoglycoside 6-adenylyltransferase [Caldilineaceae bacterium]|nr:aminoglycoside 6-adenylyltransferase [Caldilineaceae bacterium]